MFDLEMMEATGSCAGIENYSRYLTGRKPGEPPPTLFEYVPDNAIVFADESGDQDPGDEVEAVRQAVKKAGEERVAAWRFHDLRRTMATGFQRLGIRFEVTEAVLNHLSGSKSGVAGVYQRHDWKEEKRSALQVWAAHVVTLTTDKPGVNVVQ